METPQLQYILQEFPDFLMRYTPEECAFIERCQKERRRQEIQDDWRGGEAKRAGGTLLVRRYGLRPDDRLCSAIGQAGR